MNYKRMRYGWARRRGAIAVEAALVLPLLLIFITLPTLYVTLFFRQYAAAEKAAHDAALYLATAPMVELTTVGSDGLTAALTVANSIVKKELAGLVPDDGSIVSSIVCEYLSGTTPTNGACVSFYLKNPSYTLVRIDVMIGFNYVDPMTGADTGVSISPYVPVRYVGN